MADSKLDSVAVKIFKSALTEHYEKHQGLHEIIECPFIASCIDAEVKQARILGLTKAKQKAESYGYVDGNLVVTVSEIENLISIEMKS